MSGRADIDPIVSFAGRTKNPVAPPIPFRIGGFGGVEGLRTYLMDHAIDAVIDATHPFAAQMSANAANACRELGLPLAILTRPPWRPVDGDRWTRVTDMAEAVKALGGRPRRVFLTVGSRQLGAFAVSSHHHYVVRAIEPPVEIAGLPHHRLILARGPFALPDEVTLMQDERIEVLVTKNSGGSATEAKIAAARALELEVIMVERPKPEDVPAFDAIDEVMAWIDGHRPTP